MKRDNRGFSLVELIVTMAIMIILVSGAIVGVKLIAGKPAQQCAEQIRTVLLNCRTYAMGRDTATIKIYQDASTGQIMATTIKNDGATIVTPVGSKGVNVTFQLEGETSERALPVGTNALVLTFDRSSGSMKPIVADASVPLELQGKKLQYIYVRKADKAYKLTIYSLTGRVVVEGI